MLNRHAIARVKESGNQSSKGYLEVRIDSSPSQVAEVDLSGGLKLNRTRWGLHNLSGERSMLAVDRYRAMQR